MKRRVIWINTEKKRVEEVTVSSLEDMQRLVGGQIDYWLRYPNGNQLVINDEAIEQGVRTRFYGKVHDETGEAQWAEFLGNALMVGPADDDGNDLDVRGLTKDMVKYIRFPEGETWEMPPSTVPDSQLKFRLMVELAARDGVRDPAAGNIHMSADFFEEVVPQAKVFVYAEQVEPEYLSLYKDQQINFSDYRHTLPFKICWFERAGATPVISSRGRVQGALLDDVVVYGLLVREGTPGIFTYVLLVGTRDPETFREDLHVIYYDERLEYVSGPGLAKAPPKFVLGQLAPPPSQGSFGGDGAHYSDNNKVWGYIAKEAVTIFLAELETSAWGEVAANEKFKVKSQGVKHFPRIRKIVYIVPKKNKGQSIPGESRQVDWSHRWAVRGHWVTFYKDAAKTQKDMSRLGKDRDGNYTVYGHTWRSEHIKGPEDKPLVVDKTRVVVKKP